MLNLAFERRPLHLGDPEYGLKLEQLHARVAESSPGRPLVLVLGSSRVGAGLRPDALPRDCWTSSAAEPLVFNFALCSSNPVMELVCFRRLLADGILPRHLFVEVTSVSFNECFAATSRVAELMDPRRFQWPDVRLLARYHSQPRTLYRDWLLTRLLPASAYRFLLLDRYSPSWLPPALTLFGHEWHGKDRWGWLHLPGILAVPPKRRQQLVAEHRQLYAHVCVRFHAEEASDRALRELLALCRRQGVRASLLLMPDNLQPCYSTVYRAASDDYFQALARECEVPVVDARDWVAEEGFADIAHLTPEGAVTFTQRFAREILRPLVAGMPAPSQELGWSGSAGAARALPVNWFRPIEKGEGR